eukprot:3206764-Rhodomonas_salina.1
MSETGSNAGGSRQPSQQRRSQDLMPTEAELALIARHREHQARVTTPSYASKSVWAAGET